MSTSSLFPTAKGRAAFHAAYHACMARWPVPHESLLVDTPQGRTHVVVSGPPGAPPLVLLHGAGLTATQWVPNVLALAQAHRVYAVEMVGDFGRSEEAPPLASREEAQAWLGAVLDGLGLGAVVLGGHSLGAWLALAYAARQPERVRGLVLLAPAGGVLEAGVGLVLHLLPPRLLPTSGLVERALRFLLTPGGTLDPFAAQLFRVCLRHGRAQLPLRPSLLPETELRGLLVPTLLLVGEHERVSKPHKTVSRALALLPRAEAAVVKGAGHLLPMEQPAEVNARVLAFLERVHAGAQVAPHAAHARSA